MIGKAHLVIIRFFDFTEKAELLRNASKLKGTQTYISEDFSPRLRKIGKLLWGLLLKIRSLRINCTLSMTN